ncbi:unnamed protein product [Moneuplotes crassus]|uniref:Uncharacterized protein n=3 Tax=Euplotes crassus TaxID=5936 RepID=A0AAD1XCZ6_EUPCR|nr:unnamed protein product [Moneuplotes crassus]
MNAGHLQGITVSQRFVFGINGEFKNSLFLIEDHRVVYTAGHNVVVYNTEDKSQYFYAGSEGTQGITAISLSPNKGYIAICEKADKAQCSIFDTNTSRRRKTLTAEDLNSTEFISVAFSPVNERSNLITLSGEPDWSLMFWKWDKLKIQAQISVSVTGPTDGYLQATFNPHDPYCIVITGGGLYKYFRVKDTEIEPDHTQLNNKDEDLSSEFTCHCWSRDGYIIACTERGEIMMCESSGEFVTMIADSPVEDCHIVSICAYERGFIVAGKDGKFFIFEKSNDLDMPYKLLKETNLKSFTKFKEPNNKVNMTITSMAIASSEDTVYFTLDSNQLMKLSVALDGTDEADKFEHLIYDFHSSSVTGLDICIRKQLIVTCSTDQSVRIWNYATKSLEICKYQSDECFAVSFHPSGFHIAVALTDKILLMNVFSNDLEQYKAIQIKGCHEIQFSNGGHLFAAINDKVINVYNFWTCERPTNYQFNAHLNKVRCIHWDEDDLGFVSSGIDGAIYSWVLKDNSQRSDECLAKNVHFYSVVKEPGGRGTIYAVGSDQMIREIVEGKDAHIFDAGAPLSQIVMTKNQKALFVGTAEKDAPGCIQIYKISFEKIVDVQAHSKPVERLKLSHCNQYLFSTGQDGCLIIYDVNDRDAKDRKGEASLTYSDQVLTLPSQLEEYKNIRDQKQAENASLRSPDNLGSMIKNKNLEEEKQQLTEEIATNSIQETTKQEQLTSEKSTKESQFQDSLKKIEEEFATYKEDQKTKYSRQMLEDSTRHQQLVRERENKEREGRERIQILIETQKNELEDLKLNHLKEMETEQNNIDNHEEEIKVQKEKHQEILQQISEDAEKEKDQITKKNQTDIKKIADFSLKSKAELQLNKNRNKDLTNEIEQLKREAMDQKHLIDSQRSSNEEFKEEKEKKDKEILEKDTVIGEKEAQIYQYKKKTQELEKFKFVLDYKIKELKAEIEPRNKETDKLKGMTNDMDNSLKYFNKVNAGLGVIVDDLRVKQEKMQALIKMNRNTIRTNNILIKSFKDDIYETVQYIDDPLKLQTFTHEMYQKYVKDSSKKAVEINPEIRKEYDNQEKFLMNSKHSLEQKLKKDMNLHKKDSQKHMRENYELIKQINTLRDRRDELISKTKKSEISNLSMNNSERASHINDRSSHAGATQRDEFAEAELASKREQIIHLREALKKEKEINDTLKAETQE